MVYSREAGDAVAEVGAETRTPTDPRGHRFRLTMRIWLNHATPEELWGDARGSWSEYDSTTGGGPSLRPLDDLQFWMPAAG